MTEVMECPLCINPLNEIERNFYPCPCGYQICTFCFNTIKEQNNLCPLCRTPFALDAENRVGPQFKPLTHEEKKEVIPTIFVVSKRMVQIVGIPPRLRMESLLKKKEYLGQYGKITKIAIYSKTKNPFHKFAIKTDEPSCYVRFSNNLEASLCINALNGAKIGKDTIIARFAITEQCQSFFDGSECKIKGCMKMHHKLAPNHTSFKDVEIDKNSDKLQRCLLGPSQNNSSGYAKRAFNQIAFPPARITPTANSNLSISRTFESSKAPTLWDLVLMPDAIPMPPPSGPQIQLKPLSEVLGLNRM